jgi:hypothetical protein
MNDSKHRGSVSSHFSSSSDSDYTSSEDDETVPEIFHSKEEVPLSTGNPSLKKMRRPSGLPPPPPRRKSTNMLAPKSESCKNESENGSKSDEFENFSFNRGEEINAKAKNSMNTLKINTNPNETTALSTPTKPNISLKEQATASRLSSLRRIRAAREKKKIIKQSSVTSPRSASISSSKRDSPVEVPEIHNVTTDQSPSSSETLTPKTSLPPPSTIVTAADTTSTTSSTLITPSTPSAPSTSQTTSSTPSSPITPITPTTVSTPTSSTTNSPTKKLSKRQRVLQEIVETEKTFVTNVAAFYHGYVESIQLCDTPLKREIMGTHEIALLFSNLEQIVHLNTDMLKRLQLLIESWDPLLNGGQGGQGGDGDDECLGDFFYSFAPLFALYAQYTSNHDLAVDVMKSRFEDRDEYLALMDLCESAALSEIENATNKKRPPQLVGFYLIMPVQRVPRYKMLLQELLKRTKDTHQDVKTLPKAIAEVNKSAHLINETIRAREEKQFLAKLSTKFTIGTGSDVNLVATGRKLLYEGTLIKVCRRDLREYYFHLFSDMITYSKIKGIKETNNETYKLHRKLVLSATNVVDVNDEIAEKNKVQFAFQIVSQQKSFMVSAPTLESKQKWIDLLTKSSNEARLIENTKKRGSSNAGGGEKNGISAAVWAADSTQNQCTLCDSKFTMIKRRHHCRKCGSLVCASCSPHRLLLKNIDPLHSVRVCNTCGHEIEKRLRHSFRVHFQIHQLLPFDDIVTTELYYVKVFENDTYVGTTENSFTGFFDCSTGDDNGGSSSSGGGNYKRGTLEWQSITSTFDFEVDHLSRGTDDAGKPHRIYLEMYSRGFNTSDTLVGVGSISCMDILCCTEEIYHPSQVRESKGVQRRKSVSIKKRSGSFDLSRSNRSNDDVRSTLSQASSSSSSSSFSSKRTSINNAATTTDQVTLLSNVSRSERRNSLTNVVPNTPLIYSGSRRNIAVSACKLNSSSKKPAVLVKMIQISNVSPNNGNSIHVMGELAVSAIVSSPLEMRRGDHQFNLETMIEDTLKSFLPLNIISQMQWNNDEYNTKNELFDNEFDVKNSDINLDVISSPHTTEMMLSIHAASLLLQLAVKRNTTNVILINNLKILDSMSDQTSSKKHLKEWRNHTLLLNNNSGNGDENHHDLSMDERKKLSKRAQMIYDIVHTEKAYVRCLERLDDNFVQPYLVQHATLENNGQKQDQLKKTSSFFSKNRSNKSDKSASVMVCLQTVTQLKTLHREFLSTLQQRVTKLTVKGKEENNGESDGKNTGKEGKATTTTTYNYDDPSISIGDLFERFGSLFRLYTQYQNNYDALMDSCRTADSMLYNVLSDFRMELFSQGSPLKDLHGRDTALSHMVKPMERMLQYDRLLSLVLTATPPSHSDSTPLMTACSQLKEAQSHISKIIRDRENKDIILDVERSFVNENKFLIKGRTFIRMGPLTKVCRREDKEFYFWLFNDLLVYGHFVGNGKYKHHRSLELKHVVVSSPSYHPVFENTSQSQVLPCLTISSKNKSFVVYVGHTPDDRSVYLNNDNNNQKKVDLLMPSKSNVLQDCNGITATLLRDQWFEDIQRLTGNDSKTGTGFVAPVWQTDKSSSGCQGGCGRGFTLTRRRHHCRICGILVCNSCSPHRLVIASGNKKERVCNTCVKSGKVK